MAFAGSNRFELLGKLGEGGMGIVYEARDRERNVNVALKTLRHLEATNLYRFKREFRAVSDLSHPNIVSLYELVADHDEWFFTMEVVRGGDIIDYVRPPALAPGDSAVLGRVRRVFGQLACALHALHQAGLVHRDLKPSNVRVTGDGRAVLMDFGIVADRTEGTASARATRTVGTPSYMAPEQAIGEPPTAAADWYAFGVMLYLALTGVLPFSGQPRAVLRAKLKQAPRPIHELVGGVPADLRRLCMRLLDRRPRRRPAAATILSTLGVDPTQVMRDAAGGDVFVGRARELEVLRQALADVGTGAAGTSNVSVQVIGPSGMGKSTLVRRFLHGLPARPGVADDTGDAAPVVLCGRCHERERLSFNAFDGVMDSLSHALLDLPERVLASILSPDIGLLTRLFPVLRQVPSIESAEVPSDLPPRELRGRAARALIALLTALAEARPVVLYIDDLHWADRDSLELLIELMREAHGVLLISTLRPDDPGAGVWQALEVIAGHSVSFRIPLGPLSEAERRALLDELMARHPRAGASMHTPTLRSDGDGSPLLLVELVRFLGEAGDQDTAGALGLDELLSRRVARLAGEARALLQAAAVAGEPNPHWVLATAAELSAEAGQHALSVLRASRLIRIVRPGTDPWITIAHARVHDAVVATIPARAREQLHVSLARALEAWGHASLDALGRHWRAGGQRDKARVYLVAAAMDAEDKLAFDRAAQLYSEALELAPDEEPGEDSVDDETVTDVLLPRLGQALQLAGRSFEAATVYERAAARARGDEALELRRLAADEWLRSGHMKRGLERLGGVMRELGARYARTRAGAVVSLLVQRARLAVRGRGYQVRPAEEVSSHELARLDTLYAAATTLGFIDHLRGTAVQTHHVLEALAVGEEHRVCRALGLEYAYLCVSGKSDTPEVEDLGREVLAQARRLDDPYTLGVVLLCRGGAQYFCGRHAQAVRTLRESDDLLRVARRAVEWERRTAQYLLSLARINIGDLSAELRGDARYVHEAERSNDVYARTMFMCLPGTWARLAEDRPEVAIHDLDTALRGWPDDAFYVAGYVEAFGRVMALLYMGRAGAALAHMDRALPGIRKLMLHRVPWVWSEINVLIARAALEAEDWPAARRRARKAIGVVARAPMDYSRGAAALLRAGFHERDGRRDAAVRELQAAMDQLAAVSARHLVAACQMRLGALLMEGRGDERLEGKELVRQGREALRQCGVARPERMVEFLAPGFGAPGSTR